MSMKEVVQVLVLAVGLGASTATTSSNVTKAANDIGKSVSALEKDVREVRVRTEGVAKDYARIERQVELLGAEMRDLSTAVAALKASTNEPVKHSGRGRK